MTFPLLFSIKELSATTHLTYIREVRNGRILFVILEPIYLLTCNVKSSLLSFFSQVVKGFRRQKSCVNERLN